MTITEEVKNRIDALADKNGGKITADEVLEDARNPSSPLHEQFEWDDSVAAELHRKEQARRLIRSVRVTIHTDTLTVRSIAYIRDPEVAAPEQGYVSMKKLLTDREMAVRALNDELGRAMGAAQRAADIAQTLGFAFEAEPIARAIHEAQERLNIEAVA